MEQHMIVFISDQGRAWSSADLVTGPDGVEARLPPNIAALWNDAELAGWRLMRKAPEPQAPPPPVVRETHTAWLKVALDDLGVLDAVNSAVVSANRREAVLWEYGTSIREDDPSVLSVASALGLNVASLFDAAEAIKIERLRQ
jgi:hypothetical protein